MFLMPRHPKTSNLRPQKQVAHVSISLVEESMPRREIYFLVVCVALGALIGASLTSVLYKVLLQLGVLIDYDK